MRSLDSSRIQVPSSSSSAGSFAWPVCSLTFVRRPRMSGSLTCSYGMPESWTALRTFQHGWPPWIHVLGQVWTLIAMYADATRKSVRRGRYVCGSVMPQFKLDPIFTPTADQPQAIDDVVARVEDKQRFVTLLGATGTGKTMTMAATIERLQRA